MARLTLKKSYLTIGELLNRWGHTFDDFQYIIENSDLDVYVRPLALRAAALPARYVEKLERCPLDPIKVFRLVHAKQDRIKVQDFQDPPIRPKADIAFEISVGDVVVRMSDIEELEREYSETSDKIIEVMSKDCRNIKVGDNEFIFGEKQAAVIKCLYERLQAGDPWVHGKTLLKIADSAGIKLHALFRRNKNWRRIIKSDARGRYRFGAED